MLAGRAMKACSIYLNFRPLQPFPSCSRPRLKLEIPGLNKSFPGLNFKEAQWQHEEEPPEKPCLLGSFKLSTKLLSSKALKLVVASCFSTDEEEEELNRKKLELEEEEKKKRALIDPRSLTWSVAVFTRKETSCLFILLWVHAVRKVLTRKVLNLKIGLRVVVTASCRHRHREQSSGQRG